MAKREKQTVTPDDVGSLDPLLYDPNESAQIGSDLVPLAPGEVVTRTPGRLYPTVNTPLNLCPTNLDLSTYDGKAAALAAGNPGDIVFDDKGSAVIVATHYLIFPEQREDPETGEIGQFCRTVLFTKHGRIFRTTAAHAPHRIAAALDMFGPEEWAAGIPFLIRERRNRAGTRTYHDIRLATRDQIPRE